MKISIKNIRFRNFRSFKEQVSIDLNNGLYNIRGLNLETGSSSGSGKSNFHLAISFLFGYNPFPATELQSSLSVEQLQVEATVFIDNSQLEIKRGKENSVNGLFNGKQISIDGATGINTFLNRLFNGIPIEFIELLTYREQRERGKFFKMTDSQKREFLSDLLLLDKFEQEIDKSKDLVKSLVNTIDSQKKQADNLLSMFKLPAKPEGLDDLKAKIHEISLAVVKKQKEKNACSIVKTQLHEEISLLESEFNKKYKTALSNEMDDISTSLDEINKSERALRKELESMRGRRSTLKSFYEARVKEIDKEADFLIALEKNTCPTCEREWDDNQAQLEESRIKIKRLDEKNINELSQIDGLSFSILDLEEKLLKLEEIRKETTAARAKIENKIEKELAPDRAYIDARKSLLPVQDASIDLVDRELRPLNNQYNDLTSKLSKLELAINTYSVNLKNYEDNLIRVNGIRKEALDNENKLKKEQLFLELNRDFLGQIFAEVLNEISVKTNEILSYVPNVKNVTVHFQTQTETQKGVVKTSITPKLYKNGEEVSMRSGLSGGQFASLELAMDLAVADVIANRTGLQLDWLVLDEPFEGLGNPDKEACLYILKKYVANKTVFVIDHSSEIKEHFDKFIYIEYKDGKSNLKSISDNLYV